MVGPNPLRVLRRNQTHEWVTLRTHENEGKKKSPNYQGQKITREPSGKNWAGIPGDCQELGILGTCSKATVGLKQFKWGAKKHKEQEQICLY